MLRSSGDFSDWDELKFTEAKINKNLSNYSAWHNRALLLQHWTRSLFTSISTPAAQSPPNDATKEAPHRLFDKIFTFATSETELLKKSFYCDPGDQSPWIYAANLLSIMASVATATHATDFHAKARSITQHMLCVFGKASRELYEDMHQERSDMQCEETLGQEPFWPLWLQQHLAAHYHAEIEAASRATGPSLMLPMTNEQMLEQLMKMDPQRRGLYEEQLRLACE
jgi:geranylgeranyl transferase type-2 subunit alpha